MPHIKAVLLIAAFAVMVTVVPGVGFADEKLEGKVVSTNLTMCNPKPTGGGCQGDLTLETKSAGAAQQMAITVTADTIIRKGKDFTLLPATQGNSVVVNYVTEKGQKIAKSIDVVGIAR